MEKESELLVQYNYMGDLLGHGDYVTSIVCGYNREDDKESEILVSGGRDKKVILWKTNADDAESSGGKFGEALVALTGHNHFVSSLSLSSDNNFVLSSSWDKSLRLWNLKSGKCMQKFFGSSKEIMGCAFSNDIRQIFSCGFDNKLTLWNTKGQLKAVSTDHNHFDCVSQIKYSPSQKYDYYASVGWDGKLKIWNKFFKIQVSIKAHQEPINALAINTNGIYLATGGKGQVVKVWKVKEMQEPQVEFESDSNIQDLAFHPELQWIAAACDKSLRIWDIGHTSTSPLLEIKSSDLGTGKVKFTALAWNKDGKYLYAGCSDGVIRVYNIDIDQKQ